MRQPDGERFQLLVVVIRSHLRKRLPQALECRVDKGVRLLRSPRRGALRHRARGRARMARPPPQRTKPRSLAGSAPRNRSFAPGPCIRPRTGSGPRVHRRLADLLTSDATKAGDAPLNGPIAARRLGCRRGPPRTSDATKAGDAPLNGPIAARRLGCRRGPPRPTTRRFPRRTCGVARGGSVAQAVHAGEDRNCRATRLRARRCAVSSRSTGRAGHGQGAERGRSRRVGVAVHWLHFRSAGRGHPLSAGRHGPLRLSTTLAARSPYRA